jgi:hypothetical protein
MYVRYAREKKQHVYTSAQYQGIEPQEIGIQGHPGCPVYPTPPISRASSTLVPTLPFPPVDVTNFMVGPTLKRAASSYLMQLVSMRDKTA